ncbi:unnamed protein product [Clonostachys rosea]|uniref:Methyltransferase type 11 domain-containing protein n=1 Tax=Bionectria ochroleuca TaxID=29856 RepID=A0ABY6UTF5_BIOOC|nr:unnamed protein product [Clonostachys rosea]
MENEENGDAQSIITVYSTAPDALEEACSDLENEIECLMALSPLIDESFKSEGEKKTNTKKQQQDKASNEKGKTGDVVCQEASPGRHLEADGRKTSRKRPLESDESPPESQNPRTPEQQDTDASLLDLHSATSSLTIADDIDISKHPLSKWTYYFPREEHDMEMADMMHDMTMRLRNQELTLAPLSSESTQRILDLVADQYPSTTVLGWDVASMQLPKCVPPNLWWEIQDFETEWDYEDVASDPFDFIHGSEIMLAVKDQSALFERALKYLKPGGWFELKFLDYTVHSDHAEIDTNSPLVRVWHELEQALGAHGVDTAITSRGKVADLLKSQGFSDIREMEYRIPLGTWAKGEKWKYIGLEAQTIFYDNLRSLLTTPLLETPDWPEQTAIDEFAVSVKDAMKSRELIGSRLHIYYRVVCGQKPVPDSEALALDSRPN